MPVNYMEKFDLGISEIESGPGRKKLKPAQAGEVKSPRWLIDSFDSGIKELESGKKEFEGVPKKLGRALATLPPTLVGMGAGLVEYAAETPKRSRQEILDALSMIQRRGAPPQKKPPIEEMPFEERTSGMGKFGLFMESLDEVLGKGVKGAGEAIEYVRGTEPVKFAAEYGAKGRVAKAMVGKELPEEAAKLINEKKYKEAEKYLVDIGFVENLGAAEKYITEPIARGAAGLAKKMRGAAEDIRPVSKRGTTMYYATGAIEGIGPMAITTVAAMVAKKPHLALPMMFPQVLGQGYSEDRAKGKSTTEAARDNTYKALVEIASEGIPLGILTRPGGKLKTRIFKAGAAEGLQEATNEAVSIAYDEGILDEKTPANEIGKRLVDAGIIGAVGGAGMGALVHPLAGKEKETSDNLKDDVLDSVVEVYGKGEQTAEETIGSLAEGYRNKLFSDEDLDGISKKHPELKTEIDLMRESVRVVVVKDTLVNSIDTGLETGIFRGEEFTDTDAVDFIRQGLSGDIFTVEDVDGFKEKYPSLRSDLNSLIAEQTVSKVEELLPPLPEVEPKPVAEPEPYTEKDVTEVYTRAKERVRTEPLTLDELQTRFRERHKREATVTERETMERLYEKAKKRSMRGKFATEKKEPAPIKTQAELDYEAYEPVVPGKAGVKIRESERTYPRGAKYVAGKEAPEGLVVEYKPILSTAGTPYKKAENARKALTRHNKLKKKGITIGTHKVVKVKGGYGIVAIKDKREYVPSEVKKEEVKGKTLLSWVRAMGGVKDKTLPGEIRALSAKETGVVGLTTGRQDKGLAFDEMASAAVEHGWLPENTEDLPGAFSELLRNDVFAQKEGKQRIERQADIAEKSEREERWKEFERAEDGELEYFAKHEDEMVGADLDEWQRESIEEIRKSNDAKSAREIEESTRREVEESNPDMEGLKEDEGFTEYIEGWSEKEIIDEETLAELEAWRVEQKKEPTRAEEKEMDRANKPKPITTRYRKLLKKLKKEQGKKAYFDESLKDSFKEEPQEILDAYRKLHPTGASVLYQEEGDMGVIISPSSKRLGRWQVTSFDSRGFSGDTNYKTEADAFAEAYRDGYRVPDPQRGQEQMISPEFVEGIAKVEAARKEWTKKTEPAKPAKPEKPKPVAKSKGHIGFTDKYEYFKDEGGDGDLFRAPIENPLDVNGIRQGARFESTEAATPLALEIAGLKKVTPKPEKAVPEAVGEGAKVVEPAKAEEEQPGKTGQSIEVKAYRGIGDEKLPLNKKGSATFFTDSKEMAETHAKPSDKFLYGEVTSHRIKMKNPLVVDYEGKAWDDAIVVNGKNFNRVYDVAKYAQKSGHDGLIAKNIYDSGNFGGGGEEGTTYAIFDPAQVKGKAKPAKPEGKKVSVAAAEVKAKGEAWQSSDLATKPDIPIGRTEAKKQADGTYKLFFRGTRNEVFEGEKFKSVSEAKQFFKVQQIKAKEEIKYSRAGVLFSEEEQLLAEAKIQRFKTDKLTKEVGFYEGYKVTLDGKIIGVGATKEMAKQEAAESLKKEKLEAESKKKILDRGRSEISKYLGIKSTNTLLASGRVRLIVKSEADKMSVSYLPSGVRGFYTDGISYLVVDNIPDGSMWNVLMHELGVHHGYQKIFGTKLSREIFAAFVSENGKQTKLGRAVSSAMRRVPYGTRPDYINEEALAYFIEENANRELSLMRKIIARVRLWAVKYLGVRPSVFSEEDYIAIALGAIRKEVVTAKNGMAEAIPESRELFYSVDIGSDEWHDANIEYNEFYDGQISRTVNGVRSAREGESQQWSVTPISKISKIWNEFITDGKVSDKRGLYEIAEQMVENVARIQVNTELSGHTGVEPNDILDMYGIEPLTEDEFDKVGDWITDPKTGQYRITDVGMQKLHIAAIDIIAAKTPEKKLAAIDKLLNVVHMRSDLSALFVEGGRGSLDELATESKADIRYSQAEKQDLKKELINIGAKIDGNNVTLYRGGDVSKKELKKLRYNDYLSLVKDGLDATGNAGASSYGKNIIKIKIPITDIKITNGEIQYTGKSESMEGGVKYPPEIYRAYNDFYGSNYTVKEIDKQDNVRSAASPALIGGREEFDKLLEDWNTTKAGIRYSQAEKQDLKSWADDLIKSAKTKGVVLDKTEPTPERLRETSISILAGLDLKKLNKPAASFLEGMSPKGKGYGQKIEEWLASPEWYQHPVLKRIVDRALSKSEKFHTLFNEFNAVDDPMAEHDTVAKTLEALARKGKISKAAFILGRTSSDFKKLETLLDDADVYEEKHTEEELKKKGYSDDVIQAWTVVRESYDKQLEARLKPMKDLVARIKERAAFEGKEPVYPDFGEYIIDGKKRKLNLKEATMYMGQLKGTYSPRMRDRGDWVITGKIKKTMPEGGDEYVRFNRRTKSFANLLRDDLENQGYSGIKVEKESRLPEETFQAVRLAELGTVIGEAAKKGLDKYNVEQQMAFMDEVMLAASDTLKSRGSRSIMIRRQRGAVVKGYITNPLIRFIRYTGNNASGIAKAEMAEGMIKDLYGEYRDGKKVGGIDATKEGDIHSLARAYIEEQLRNAEAGDRIVGMMKGLTTLKFLGFNPRTVLVNMSALTTSVPMALHTYAMDGKGSLLKIGKVLSVSCKDYTKVMAGKRLSNVDEMTFMDDFRANGYTDAQYTRDATGNIRGAYGTAWSKLMSGSMYVFGKSEEWVRGGTALAAYRLCRKQGLSHTEANIKAIEATAKAHGTYGKETLPMVAWGKGVGRLGQAFYTYLKFPHNYLQMLYDSGIRKKNIKGAIFGLAAPAVLGGVSAVPMYSAVIGIANALLSLIDDDRDAEKLVYDTLNEYLGETGEKAIRGGALGLLDVDISGSLSMGPGSIPTSLFDLTGAVGGMAQDISKGVGYAASGEYVRAAEKMLPKAVGNIFTAIREVSEGATTTRGDRVWDENGMPYMPTAGETAKRALGFRSARRAQLSQTVWVSKREEKRFKETSSEINKRIKFLAAKVGGDDLESAVQAVTSNPEIADKISEYNRNALKTSNVPLVTPSSIIYQIRKMEIPAAKKKARATRAERVTTFEGDIWAAALGVVDRADATQAEVKRLADLGILNYSAPPSRTIDMGRDVSVTLDDDQYSRYVIDTSATVKERVDHLLSHPEWDTWSDKRKVYVVKRAIKKGRKRVRDNLKRSIRKSKEM